jgi:hypothetical protein
MGRVRFLLPFTLYVCLHYLVYCYYTILDYDKEFNKHITLCFRGTEPSQIFLMDNDGSTLSPKESYQKYYTNIPFYLKIIYVMAYYVGQIFTLHKSIIHLVYALYKYFILKHVFTHDDSLQGYFNQVVIDFFKLFLPWTTFSF